MLHFALLGLFLLITLALGWQPLDRTTWIMENLLVAALLAVLLAGHRRFRLSPGAAVALCAFLTLHEIGAHYGYAQVPYDAGWRRLTGRSLDLTLGFERNQFDRLVHFTYGLLLARPWREVIVALTGLHGWRASYLALEFILASSATYELMEWVGGDYFHGADIVGAQDDFWDAQKDMALAALGALLALMAGRHGAASGTHASRDR
ncbi:membrane protein [Pseudomonas oryzihabitans]|nr:membrane protein [Pseudomonas psychrotolerans]KTT22823.1 membrane protein [Pseudomonas psychrotolerans]KTT60305.1 membrane protein [Pseudomonas psychrotolerans]